MKKADLIAAVAKKQDLSVKKTGELLDEFLQEITQGLKKGETVPFIGFGTFNVKDRAKRAGRNPQTGETIKIPAAKVVRFKAGIKLKDAVNKK